MHIVVDETERLQKAISRVAAVVGKSDANPVQAAIKLWTQDDRLLITGLDVTAHQLTLGVDAKVHVPGAVLIEADHFSKTMARVEKYPLVIQYERGEPLNVVCGQDRHAFATFGAELEDFPMESQLPVQAAVVAGLELANLQKALMYGTLNKEQDLSFASVPDEPRLRGYTGDGSSGLLVRCEAPLSVKSDEFTFKIPHSVWRHLPTWTGDVGIHAGLGLVVFTCGDEHFLVRIADTDVNCANFDFVFDKPAAGYFTAETKKFRDKIGTLRVSKTTQIASLRPLSDERLLVLSAVDHSRSTSHLKVGLGDVFGETPKLEFDSSCLDKAAQAVGVEVAKFEYLCHVTEGDDFEVWVLKILDEANPKARQAVVMPVQI